MHINLDLVYRIHQYHNGILTALKAIADEFCVDEKDIFSMIDAYFDTKFRKPVDYRFGHFATDMVFEILYFQTVH